MQSVSIKTIQDIQLGSLSFFEANRDVPFPIQRVYYTYHVPNGARRGGHAHRDLQQMLFCTYGEIEVILDDGNEKSSIILDDPSKGLVIGNGIWREMIWRQEESVLCVVASGYYDEADYIRKYEDFAQLVKEGYWK